MKHNAVETFFRGFPQYTYKRGEIVLRSGDPPAGVVYLATGYMRMYAMSDRGEMLVTQIFKPGSFFPMWWAFNDTPNGYTYDAITPVEIYRAPKPDVIEFIKSHPDALYDLTSRILAGLSGLVSRMEMLVFEEAITKVIKLLIYYAKNFGDTVTDSRQVAGEYVVSLTQREIAAWIGTTRETASLQLELLKKRGLVSYRNRNIRIPDLGKLEAELKK